MKVQVTSNLTTRPTKIGRLSNENTYDLSVYCTTYINTERPIFIKNRRSQNRHADGRTKLRKTVLVQVYKKVNEGKKPFCINVINKGEKTFFYTDNLYPFRVNFMISVLIVL